MTTFPWAHALVAAALLAVAIPASAAKITIKSGIVTVTVDCADLKITGKQTCKGLCDDINAGGGDCTYDSGKLVIRDHGHGMGPLSDLFVSLDDGLDLEVEPMPGLLFVQSDAPVDVFASTEAGEVLGMWHGLEAAIPLDAGAIVEVYATTPEGAWVSAVTAE